ncbi:hypothetical protein HHI36_001385 [Cryptolaemus montrouzieri]|uniref:CAF17 C-terminal domain-containing protein n=1 Tax=Cryptolaemus montrouzieri TaxID=559131 RepID=A0ABD2P841_9CUCU
MKRLIMLIVKGVLGIPVMKKCFCTSSYPNFILKHLKQRSLISVVGDEASIYLQGLITNDIQHLSSDCTSQYSLFLNSKGRVLYDSLIYRINYKSYFVECDSSIVTNLEKHLKMYRLRRKVEIATVGDYQLHTLYDKDTSEEIINNHRILNIENVFGILAPYLGYRIISKKETDIEPILQNSLQIDIDTENGTNYRKLRYCLGIGEGVIDLPSGNCFPLESNCDYLHGVSFHKGCYIGQELTARTYHTGVTRKRLMPIYFSESLKEMPADDSVLHEKIKLGKIRGIEENIGLALIRFDLVNSNQSLKVFGTEAIIGKPFWWPIEAPKDKMSLKKIT